MVSVRFSNHLKRFVDLPDSFECDCRTVREVLESLENAFPGVSGYLIHENGQLRQHVNVFLDDAMVTDRQNLSDSLEEVREVAIMQALSGG